MWSPSCFLFELIILCFSYYSFLSINSFIITPKRYNQAKYKYNIVVFQLLLYHILPRFSTSFFEPHSGQSFTKIQRGFARIPNNRFLGRGYPLPMLALPKIILKYGNRIERKRFFKQYPTQVLGTQMVPSLTKPPYTEIRQDKRRYAGNLDFISHGVINIYVG